VPCHLLHRQLMGLMWADGPTGFTKATRGAGRPRLKKAQPEASSTPNPNPTLSLEVSSVSLEVSLG
jgi:hypothetical protein